MKLIKSDIWYFMLPALQQIEKMLLSTSAGWADRHQGVDILRNLNYEYLKLFKISTLSNSLNDF